MYLSTESGPSWPCVMTLKGSCLRFVKGSTESWVTEIINDLCPEWFYDFTWVSYAWFSRKEIHLYSIYAIRLNIQGWWEVHMLQPIAQWCFCRPHKSGWCHFLISFCSFFLLKVSCSIQDYTQDHIFMVLVFSWSIWTQSWPNLKTWVPRHCRLCIRFNLCYHVSGPKHTGCMLRRFTWYWWASFTPKKGYLSELIWSMS